MRLLEFSCRHFLLSAVGTQCAKRVLTAVLSVGWSQPSVRVKSYMGIFDCTGSAPPTPWGSGFNCTQGLRFPRQRATLTSPHEWPGPVTAVLPGMGSEGRGASDRTHRPSRRPVLSLPARLSRWPCPGDAEAARALRWGTAVPAGRGRHPRLTGVRADASPIQIICFKYLRQNHLCSFNRKHIN